MHLPRPFAPLILLACCVTASLALQDGSPPPSADEIIHKVTLENDLRTARLRSYRSTRVYEVDYKGFGGDRHAKMVVNINYQSGQKTFSVVTEEGSKLLLNRVIRKALESEQQAATDEMRPRSALTPANYAFEFVNREVKDGRAFFVLRVTPKRKDKYLYDGKVWIDATDYAIARIESEPAKTPSFWITATTIQHQNADIHGIWLPAHNLSTSKIRFGGHAQLTIDYGKYDELVAD